MSTFDDRRMGGTGGVTPPKGTLKVASVPGDGSLTVSKRTGRRPPPKIRIDKKGK